MRDDGVERGRVARRSEGVERAPRGRREELELVRRAGQEARDDDEGVEMAATAGNKGWA